MLTWAIFFIVLCSVNSQSPYIRSQNFSEPAGKVSSIDVSDANDILVIGSYDDLVNLYTENINKTSFQFSQNFNASEDDVENVDVTGDGKWILVIDYSGKVLLYKMNQTT